ncbi:hypothetical protein [Desulforamulus ferrireducens]|uniref:Sporulation membrane protein YtrI C-terminal domain-containing protein n=1 Tax=Desulforamulus ferrireducens TaxID=1833852 RepID=A0A1S6IZ43_9FIRM|nr:hypothetical protein [Desulforamulus ferrireducens]AQS60041.1 hypothetical protein B0537_13745 [Desulforamulus ferrireducens]
MKSGLYRVVAGLLLGILLGAAGTNILIGQQIDKLSLQNKTLQNQLADTQRELQKLKQSSHKQKKKTVISIETYLILTSREGLTDYDELKLKSEANDKVKQWLEPLIGQEVAELDILWIPNILDNREVEANGNLYRLKSHLVVIDEKITVYLKATQIKNEAKVS